MAVHLADTITTKDANALRKMIADGWNVKAATAELKRRGEPVKVKATKVSKGGRPRFKARGITRVTGGYVNPVGYARLGREILPGQRIEPWN